MMSLAQEKTFHTYTLFFNSHFLAGSPFGPSLEGIAICLTLGASQVYCALLFYAVFYQV